MHFMQKINAILLTRGLQNHKIPFWMTHRIEELGRHQIVGSDKSVKTYSILYTSWCGSLSSRAFRSP